MAKSKKAKKPSEADARSRSVILLENYAGEFTPDKARHLLSEGIPGLFDLLRAGLHHGDEETRDSVEILAADVQTLVEAAGEALASGKAVTITTDWTRRSRHVRRSE